MTFGIRSVYYVCTGKGLKRVSSNVVQDYPKILRHVIQEWITVVIQEPLTLKFTLSYDVQELINKSSDKPMLPLFFFFD